MTNKKRKTTTMTTMTTHLQHTATSNTPLVSDQNVPSRPAPNVAPTSGRCVHEAAGMGAHSRTSKLTATATLPPSRPQPPRTLRPPPCALSASQAPCPPLHCHPQRPRARTRKCQHICNRRPCRTRRKAVRRARGRAAEADKPASHRLRLRV